MPSPGWWIVNGLSPYVTAYLGIFLGPLAARPGHVDPVLASKFEVEVSWGVSGSLLDFLTKGDTYLVLLLMDLLCP